MRWRTKDTVLLTYCIQQKVSTTGLLTLTSTTILLMAAAAFALDGRALSGVGIVDKLTEFANEI